MASVGWSCRCGSTKGTVADLSPTTANRCICYCHDCRAFAHWLERDDLLDAHGGVDIVQVARAHFAIETGRDQLRCLRLSHKGLHRWYAECCKTPVANTMPRLPFAGLCRVALDCDAAMLPDPDLIHGRSAIGGIPPGASAVLSFRAGVRPAKLFASWALRRLGHPTPLFDRHEVPVHPPRVLDAAERDALRAHPRA
jgi:hypothetical protein